MDLLRNYLEDFEGVAASSTFPIEADKTMRLPDQPCRFVQLFHWNTGDDMSLTRKADIGLLGSSKDDENEVYYGFGQRLCGQLFVGEHTDLIPVKNLNQIIVRTRPSKTATIYVAWFR
jgi:hypothetical protein